MKNPGIDMVFFDAGETLLHPHPSFPELFAQVCSDEGYAVQPSDVSAVQERLAPHLVDLAEETGVENPSLSAADSERFWTFLYRRFLEELRLDPSLDGKLFTVFSSIETYRLFDDVLPVLDELSRAGYRLGLISNFEGWLEKMLVELEIGHVFEVAVISGLEGVEKPDPRIYEIATERAAVDPSRAVHVGDSVGLDVVPATQVGINAVLVDRVGRYREAPCPKIDSLEDLTELIAKL